MGFYVVPRSVNLAEHACDDARTADFSPELGAADSVERFQPASGDVKFSYSVIWRESDTRWRYRFEPLLSMNTHDVETNWFSITNAVLVLTAISFVVGLILLRLLRRDLLRYAELEELLLYDDIERSKHEFAGGGPRPQGESFGGWKTVANDVFRAPPCAGLLCVCVGTGAQVFVAALLLLTVSLTGVFSPANRGAFTTTAIVLYTLLGFVGGYCAVLLRMKLSQSKESILRVSVGTAMVFPGLLFLLFIALNVLAGNRGSSGAVPLGTVMFMLLLWLGVNLPSSVVGSFFAYRHIKHEVVKKKWPTKTNLIARAIPPVPWWQNRYVMGFMLGIVPFLVSFAQLFFVVSKMLLHQFVYVRPRARPPALAAPRRRRR